MRHILIYMCMLQIPLEAKAQNLQQIESQLQQIMLKIAKIYDCKNIAHLPDDNTTAIDKLWMSYFNDKTGQHVTLLPKNNSVTLPGRHPYRLCLTSFSHKALKNATFLDREYQRPIKVHLDLDNEDSVPITYWYRYNGTDFDSPPLISIQSVSNRKS